MVVVYCGIRSATAASTFRYAATHQWRCLLADLAARTPLFSSCTHVEAGRMKKRFGLGLSELRDSLQVLDPTESLLPT